MIHKDVTKERLIIIQKKLLNNQIDMNKSMENNAIEVLVENKLENQNKYFGRNKFLSSVIFDGNQNHLGKLVGVNINSSNLNTLFGIIENNMNAA